MTNDIIVYGTKGLALETAMTIAMLPKWNHIGYFDDNVEIGTLVGYGKLPVLDPDLYLGNMKKTVYISIAIADPATKEKIYCKILKHENVKLATIISPTAIVAPDASIGDGSIVGHYAVIGPDVRIGKCVLMNTKFAVGHSTEIGDFSTFLTSTNISGDVSIGRKCFCGDQSFVIQNRKIGDNVLVGAGSRVFTNIPDGWSVFGYPATKL